MKLKRLKIEKFRGVQPGTVIEFCDGFNVLLGQNGTGKTTLLRLISSIFVGDFRWLEEESFAVEYELVIDDAIITFAMSQAEAERPGAGSEMVASFVNLFDIKLQRFRAINFLLRFQNGDSWELRCDERKGAARWPGLTEPHPLEGRATLLHRGLLGPGFYFWGVLLGMGITDSTHPALKVLTRLFEASMTSWRFDESLEVFLAITGRISRLGESEYAHDAGVLRFTYDSLGNPIPTDMRGNLLPGDVRSFDWGVSVDAVVPALTLRHEQAAFLADVVRMLEFSTGEMQFEFDRKDVKGQFQSIAYGNLRFLFTRRDGSIINQDHLSYGQKRLLTFYYYLACNPHVVIADELVNGLHHSWIEECMKAMAGRQVFLTSQNPILLDHLSFDSAESVRRTFVTCEAIPEGPRDRLLWGNMSKKDAASFYKAYKVGIQHVGDILRTKGLW